MKKKFRYYLHIINGDGIAKIFAVLCIVCDIVTIVHYWYGDIDRASFWLICGMFNYLCYKL